MSMKSTAELLCPIFRAQLYLLRGLRCMKELMGRKPDSPTAECRQQPAEDYCSPQL